MTEGAAPALSFPTGGPYAPPAFGQSDPLPSWNDGAAKSAIVEFVEAVTTDGPDFVAPDERIGVFDNDGTLWVANRKLAMAALALLTGAAPAAAQSTNAVDTGDRWLVRIAPYLWATSLDGNATVAGMSRTSTCRAARS